MKKHGLMDKPRQVINVDESGFGKDKSQEKVFAERGKNAFQAEVSCHSPYFMYFMLIE